MPLKIQDKTQWKSWSGSSHHKLASETRMRFVGVDGEGVRDAYGRHRYVLFGVGDRQIENPEGLTWKDCFKHLYRCYEKGVVFVGFFLAYDFTQWFKTMPQERVWRLLTTEGIASRKHRLPHRLPHPVEYDGWQFDMLGMKRLRIRPKTCDCVYVTCKCAKKPWMYLCDVGSFFQTSLVSVLDPKNWKEPVVTDDEYQLILEGKKRRKDAVLDDDMRRYNRLENEILSRVMESVDEGFMQMKVHLPAQKWFGPGQVAQAWMKGKVVERKQFLEVTPDWVVEAARASYFGGWFETFIHGIIPGVTYEYDINSAYPYIISRLPCLEHGTWNRGNGVPKDSRSSDLVLVKAEVHGFDERPTHIGAMLHRDKKGRISRPVHTAGWYWKHELDAAVRAQCIREYVISEWIRYDACECPAPLKDIEQLYLLRLQVGKDTPLGKGCKVGYNSFYGKFAQSIGDPVFGNAVYASLITAGCRTMILDAIATHPEGKSAVAMIATDGVYFTSRHPGLSISDRLGEWGVTEKNNLCVFKPGVYWDDKTREMIKKGEENPKFKARGINVRDFAKHLREVDDMFWEWRDTPAVNGVWGEDQWPEVSYRGSFAMTTCLQAIRRGDWGSAGTVTDEKPLVQSSNPKDKRQYAWKDGMLIRSEPYVYGAGCQEGSIETFPYVKRFGAEDPWSQESREEYGITWDSYVGDELRDLLLDSDEGIDYETEFQW